MPIYISIYIYMYTYIYIYTYIHTYVYIYTVCIHIHRCCLPDAAGGLEPARSRPSSCSACVSGCARYSAAYINIAAAPDSCCQAYVSICQHT